MARMPAAALKSYTGDADAPYLELQSDSGQKECPAAFPRVHHAETTDLITNPGNYTVHIFIIEQIWNVTYSQRMGRITQ